MRQAAANVAVQLRFRQHDICILSGCRFSRGLLCLVVLLSSAAGLGWGGVTLCACTGYVCCILSAAVTAGTGTFDYSGDP